MQKDVPKIVAALKRKLSYCGRHVRCNPQREVYLHENFIMSYDPQGDSVYTLAGWGTASTRRWLNAIAYGVGHKIEFYQRDNIQRVRIHGTEYDVEPLDRIIYHAVPKSGSAWMTAEEERRAS